MLAGVLAAYDRVLVWLGLRSRHASRATAATPREYRGRHATNTLARDLADAVAAGVITVNQARQNAKVTAMDILGIAPNMPDPRRIEPQTDGSLVAPVAGLYKVTGPTFRGGYPAGNKGLSRMAPPPASMSKPRPPATDQPRPFGGWGYKAGPVPASALGLPPAAACEPATDQPRPGSLPELGQRIADSLMPWFDKAADTVTLPVVVTRDGLDLWSGDMDFHNGVGDNLYFACNCDVSTPIDPNSVSLKVDWREGRTEQPMTQYGRADKL